MKIYLYKTKSSNNTIGKVLTDECEVEIKFKDEADIRRPVIKLKLDRYDNYNYCYIPMFERYYYIEDLTILVNGLYQLRLNVDVLESFKDDILNSYAYIIQKEDVNPYYDSGYKSEVRSEIDTYTSDVEVEYEDVMLATVLGGEI